MGVDRGFSKPAGEKQAGLCNNKTKLRSYHTAVGTLQHSKEHLAPTWTPTRDFCWIIHSGVSNSRLPSAPLCFPPPLCIIYESVSFLFNGATREGNTHGHAHAQTHKVKYDPGNPFSVFYWLFARKNVFCRREFWWQILSLKTFQARQTAQRWAFHARILQRGRSASNCEGGLFTYLPHSRHFDLFETVGFMMLGRHVTVAWRAS